MGGGHADLTSKVILGKLQAWQTPLSAPSVLPELASVLHTETDHIEKSGDVAAEQAADSGGKGGGRIHASWQEGQGPQRGAEGGNAWHNSRLLGFACLSLLHPSGAEVGLLVPAPPGWGQGAQE